MRTYGTLTESVVLWLTTPAVAVIVTDPLSATGWTDSEVVEPLPSPQLAATARHITANASPADWSRLFGRVISRASMASSAIASVAISPGRIRNAPQRNIGGGTIAAVPAVTVTVTVPDEETVPGTEQVTFARLLATVHENATVPAKSFTGVT